jgi:hypothetical protein
MTSRFKPGGSGQLSGSMYRCTGWHERDGAIVWSQWFTRDPKTMPCPEHGTEFLVRD